MLQQVSGTDRREAKSYEATSTAAPLLHIEYTESVAGPLKIKTGHGNWLNLLTLKNDFWMIHNNGQQDRLEIAVEYGHEDNEVGQQWGIMCFHNTVGSDGNRGRISIGTTNAPDEYKLTVEGAIGCRELVVTGADWADYVFEDGYKLQNLDKVEEYIKENKRLPGVPSAEEIEKDGLSVAKMQAKLMEKVEELTLYVIELKKENAGLKELLIQVEGE